MNPSAVASISLLSYFRSHTSPIVGYQTKELASGNFTMLNVPFVNPTDANAGLQLNKDITVENVTASAEGIGDADQIWIWIANDNGYTRFFRYAGDGNTYKEGWCEAQGEWPYIEEVEEFKNGLPLGSAMYYKAKKIANKGLRGAGAIESQDEVELPLASGNFTMFGNPYPVALQLNGEKFSAENVTASADGIGDADQIWIWVAAENGYRRFFRYAGDGGTYKEGWCEAQGEWPYIEEVEGFENGIVSGTAMYYKAKKGDNKAVVFTSPLVTE